MVEEGTDVSKAEHDAPGNGLAGIPAAEEAIWITHHPAHTHTPSSPKGPNMLSQPDAQMKHISSMVVP